MTDTDLPLITAFSTLDIFVTADRLLPHLNLFSPRMVFPEELFPTPVFPRRTILMLPLFTNGASTCFNRKREIFYLHFIYMCDHDTCVCLWPIYDLKYDCFRITCIIWRMIAELRSSLTQMICLCEIIRLLDTHILQNYSQLFCFFI